MKRLFTGITLTMISFITAMDTYHGHRPQTQVFINATMQAAFNGQKTIVENFLQHSNVDTKDENGSTLLMWAASGNQHEIAESLILREANINYQRSDKLNALMYAALSGNTDTLEVLLDAKADTELRDLHGFTALMHAASGPKGKLGNIQAVKLLLSKGAKPSLATKHGILHIANEEIAKLIYDAAANKTISY